MALVVVLGVLGSAAPVAGAELLSCGSPLSRHLDAAAVDTYTITVAPGSTVEIDVANPSGVGLLKLSADGAEPTCSGTLKLAGPADAVIHVADCFGTDARDYTITANVVSGGADNCGIAMPCGLVPTGRLFGRAGEVDSYMFAATSGDRITLRAGDINGNSGSVRVRLFNPDGTLATGGDSCAPLQRLTLQQSGTYTVLVSACGTPRTGLYGLSFASPSCPDGPEVSYFGAARSDGSPRPPDDYDGEGRPVYIVSPSGFFIVVEARPGPSGGAVGPSAFNFDPNNPAVLPDLQVLLSRPIGDGSAAVCDKTLPNQGGVPATPSLDFTDTQTVADAINDFACRFDNGGGAPEGLSDQDACTSFQTGEFHFVNSTSTLQFCALIAHNWSFPPGATIVEARVRDVEGFVGPSREIVIQVGPVSHCAGDCNGDLQVTVDEILSAVGIALGNLAVTDCTAADLNGDGTVTVDEIIAAVNAALTGCG